MKYKQLMAYLMIILLIASSVACKSQEPDTAAPVDEEQEELVSIEESTDLVDVGFVLETPEERVVWEFTTVTDGTWNQPEPLINPMGTFDAYSFYEYQPNGYFYTQYLDDNFELIKLELQGEVYKLEIPFDGTLSNEENRQFQNDFKQYIKDMDGVDFGIYEDVHTFLLRDNENDLWWGISEFNEEGIILTIMEEEVLNDGESIVVDLSEDIQALRFTLDLTDDWFRSLTFDFDGQNFEASYTFDMNEKIGDYEREYINGYGFSDYMGDYYTLTNLPTESGFLRGVFEWYPEDCEGKVTLSNNRLMEMTGNMYGEDLGAIKVSSEYISHCEVTKSNKYAYFYHPDYDEYKRFMDLAPDGDYQINLPPGYWDVRLYPENAEYISDFSVLGVPVSSGQITVVEVPYSVSAANSNKADSIEARGIDMYGFSESDDEVNYQFTMLDSETKSVAPDLYNTAVYESGQPVTVTNLQRVETAPDIYLLLDSSGSMKGEMSGLLSAAKDFINGLEEGSKVTVVDFDSTVKELKGNSKTDALSNLNKLSVGGDTALFRAVEYSVSKLIESSRPIIVAFTDGENDLKGEALVLDDVVDAIERSNIPVFTIGFGENHDNSALLTMSKAGYGKYFKADDQNALTKVFSAINERLSNTYELTYKRPEIAGVGDTPILTFLIDTSGSMGEIDEGFGERMLNLKELMKPFLIELPEEYRVQIMGFNDQSYYVQSLTGDKRKMILGVDGLIPGGGTEITNALAGAVLGLKNLPSTKKVLVFVTDEAMDSKDEGFMEQVEKLGEEKVETLWVGFGNVEVHEDFVNAAELSGGDYLLTSNPSEMKNKIEELMSKVNAIPDSGMAEVSMTIKKEDSQGNIESFSSYDLVSLGPLPKSGEIVTVNAIKEYSGGALRHYDKKTASLLSGKSVPKEETIITGRMAVGRDRMNEAIDLKVNTVYFMDKIDGLEAPYNHQFIALDLSVENIMKEQKVTIYPDGSGHPSSFVAGNDAVEEVMMIPDYLIPDYKNHFFLNINDQGGIGASQVTYLTESPLINPGDVSLQLAGREIKEGALVFVVPKDAVASMILDFYDVNHGHIHVPIIGALNADSERIESLPKETASQLSESFTLAISDNHDVAILNEYGEEEGDTVFRYITGVFTSNVQALLTLDPRERIKLEIDTGQGKFYFDLHPNTATVPYGHYTEKMMAPGGQNISRWIFEIPTELTKYPSSLLVELKGNDVRLPLIENGNQMTRKNPLFTGEVDMDLDGIVDFTVEVLDAVKLTEYVGNLGAGNTVLDIVVKDVQDGYATSGIPELFILEGTNAFGEENYVTSVDYGDMILAFGEEDVIYDGTEKRGLLVFSNSYPKLLMTSPYMEALALEISEGKVESLYGTAQHYMETDEIYQSALVDAISRKIALHESMMKVESESLVVIESNQKPEIPVKAISSYGRERIQDVDTIEKMISLLKSIRYVPTDRRLQPFESIYSPEAVLTQNYGSANDFAELVIHLLSKMGYQPKLKVVNLTEEGKKVLSDFAKTTVLVDQLPAIKYSDETGSHMLVMPFVEEISSLDGLVYYSQVEDVERKGEYMSLEVNVICESLMPDRNDQMSDFSDALAGETDAGPHYDELEIFYQQLELPKICNEPLDLGFYDNGHSYEAYLSVNGQMLKGQQRVSKRVYKPVRIVLNFSTNSGQYKKTIELADNRTLDMYLMTLGLNLPDLSKEATEHLEREAKAIRDGVEDYSNYSAIKWYTRDIIYSMIANQTAYERELVDEMDVVVGRTNRERILVLTLVAPTKKQPLETMIDLVQNATDIHRGQMDDVKAFNIMGGLFQTQLESRVLGNEGIGTMEIFARTPADTGLIIVEPYLYNMDIEAMVEAGIPERLMTYFANSNKYHIMIEHAALINGQSRWAWLEVDPKTYETIGVTDSLAHGAMVTNAITGTVKDIGQYFVGQFVGTTTAIWSVAGFSLMEDDYDTILSEAKKFALGMKDSFGLKYGKFSVSVGGKPQVSQKFMDFKVSFNGKLGFGQTVYGFTQGFEAGINAYFEKAE